MKIVFKSLVFAMLVLWTSSCHVGPSNNELLSEYNIVYTKYDKAYDFAAKQYFAINEKVYTINEKGEGDSLSSADANTLISSVKSQMEARNYVYVYKNISGVFGYDSESGFVPQKPDLGINISGVSNTTTIVSYYPGGGYYGGYWGYGWGYYYPYYPTAYAYQYTNGLLLVDMFQYKELSGTEDKFNVSWTGVVRGIDTGSKSTNMQSALSGINQMFVQSPYILRSVN